MHTTPIYCRTHIRNKPRNFLKHWIAEKRTNNLMSVSTSTSKAYQIFVSAVEYLGKQLDPDFTYQPSFSPKSYFAKYTVKDYIRIIIIVGAYALIIRPLMEKGLRKLRDQANDGAGPQPVPIDPPAWQRDHEVEEAGLDWGAKIRKRAREAQKKKDEVVDQEMEDSELDKYLD